MADHTVDVSIDIELTHARLVLLFAFYPIVLMIMHNLQTLDFNSAFVAGIGLVMIISHMEIDIEHDAVGPVEKVEREIEQETK